MDELSFATNWNQKLDCNCFTTFRLHNPKYQPGKVFSITLKKKPYKKARVLEKKTVTLAQVNEFMARVDTGYSRQGFIDIVQKMYITQNLDWNTQTFDFILLETVKEAESNAGGI
ncbi:ASCH domain-containing protein [Tellurirhabdus rosea]|uniref:hypothetical protein n=1 Tax=Tellurirhabdus rosea TaxID=2674997 RepID=UPI002256CC01|nr:hypothetical protein [Tellurirhabdus rosea]